MFPLKPCIFVLAILAIPVVAQTPAEQTNKLPAQAKPVQGVVMPVPKEIFRSLDKFQGANWRAVQRPEVIRWRSHGDQAQIAILLGVVIAEGFIAMEAHDSSEVRNVGNSVLKLARGLGVEERALRRSRSIMELADKKEWASARREWDALLSDVENGMIELNSAQLSQLVSLGGWLRGTEALSALVLQNYSPDRSELIRQPALIQQLERQLVGMPAEFHGGPVIAQMLTGMRKVQALAESDNGPLSEKTVREIHGTCEGLVQLSSRRPSEH